MNLTPEQHQAVAERAKQLLSPDQGKIPWAAIRKALQEMGFSDVSQSDWNEIQRLYYETQTGN